MTKRQPGSRGRPSKRTPETDQTIVRMLKLGLPRRVAARANGVHPDTLANWCAEDAVFSGACEKAEAEAVGSFIARLAAQSQGGNVVATIYWLKCRCPEMREPKEQPASVSVGQIDGPAAMARMLLALTQQVADGKILPGVLKEAAEAVEKASSVLERADLEERVKALEAKR